MFGPSHHRRGAREVAMCVRQIFNDGGECGGVTSPHRSGAPRISMPRHNNRTRITKDFRSATLTRDESQHCVIRRAATRPHPPPPPSAPPPYPARVEHGFINRSPF
ncbi:unnamed protein product [Danaus chrysippus]|uniref:(African queen) hypothetical protein n=1 Tax=Danaus chrysippus TaxID=151541 RepID=A0A8J2QIG4_9NEOP|nr:unnamed protein product [Danaus chrysippus]